MSRKEEREQASNLVFKIKLCPRTAFIRGAEWADRHPRKGLVDIEKVCEWIEEQTRFGIHPQGAKGFVEQFRKAMED